MIVSNAKQDSDLDVLGDQLNEKKKKKAIDALKEKLREDKSLTEKFVNIFGDGSGFDEKFNLLLEDTEIGKLLLSEINCPQCGNKGTFTEARQFNVDVQNICRTC